MNTLHFTAINFYAVFVAWIIRIVIGLLWSHPWCMAIKFCTRLVSHKAY